VIEVHTIAAQERRMLLELLASERAGEEALRVGPYVGRAAVASSLSSMRMACWCDREHLVLTELGRHIAESLAQRLVAAPMPQAC
jgi:hypothetical protein